MNAKKCAVVQFISKENTHPHLYADTLLTNCQKHKTKRMFKARVHATDTKEKTKQIKQNKNLGVIPPRSPKEEKSRHSHNHT